MQGVEENTLLILFICLFFICIIGPDFFHFLFFLFFLFFVSSVLFTRTVGEHGSFGVVFFDIAWKGKQASSSRSLGINIPTALRSLEPINT